MPDASWWALQGATLVALAMCTGLAFTSSGRIGRHTPYGTFLFVITLGFWFLVVGNITYVATRAIGAWHGAPGWGDAFTLVGWAFLALAFHLLLLRFPAPGSGQTRHRVSVILVPLAAGLAGSLLVVVRAHLVGVGANADSAIRAAYLFLDGVAMGAFALSIPLLHRMRHASLGRLYGFLGAALALKTTGDIVYLFWPDGAPLAISTTALYPAGGVLAVVGLYLNHRAVSRTTTRRVLAQPGFAEGQLILRDVAFHMRGLAGELGERLVLQSAEAALVARGVRASVRDGLVYAAAEPAAWQAAVVAARGRTSAVLGLTGDAVFATVLSAYGRMDDSEAGGPA